jgi:hypothetical protein
VKGSVAAAAAALAIASEKRDPRSYVAGIIKRESERPPPRARRPAVSTNRDELRAAIAFHQQRRGRL